MAMKRILPLIFVLLSCVINGQEAQKELKVLFVGNSYTYGYNLAHIVSIMAEETATQLDTYKSVVPGAKLSEHWEGKRDLETRKLIAEGDFDLVILQAYSMSGLRQPEETMKYIKLFSDYDREHGAKTMLFNTWARERVPQYQGEIDAMYEQAAADNGILRAPVGTAWQLAMDLRPTVDLYTSDGSHPNELGCMLSATIFVASICGELPQKMPTLFRIEDARGESVRLMNHNPEDVEFCKRIAESIVFD